MRSIAGRQNPAVRLFRSLADTPDPSGVRLLLDGAHLVRDALRAGLHVEIAAVAASHLAREGEVHDIATALEGQGIEVVAVPDSVFRAISPVRTPSGIAAIALRVPSTTGEICDRERALVLVIAGVQDPGNVGSLLRAAEAGGVTGAMTCANTATPFSWKALRGSMGSALRLPIVTGLTLEAGLDALQRAGARTVAATPREGRDPDAVNWSGRLGLFLGGEGPGLPAALLSRCDERVTIPMAPQVESLNVAAAGAVLIYAARRQRVTAPHR